jgi:hypothetical protein
MDYKPKRRCYVAGPMRGYLNYNFDAFDAARDKLIKLGVTPISPADIDRAEGFDGQSEFDESTPKALRAVCRRDLEVILGLKKENGDFLVVLPGWEQSTGAMAEMAVAKWLGLPVYEFATMKRIV